MAAVIVVDWLDASYQKGEATVNELNGLMFLRTAGWLVRETPELISVALDRCDEDGTFRDITHIPRFAIKRVQRLKVK